MGLGAEPQSPPCSLECARCAAAVRACRHLPAAATTAKMPNFAGTWKMRSSENFDELLKALGKLARTACPDGEQQPAAPPTRRGWALGTNTRQEGVPGAIDWGEFQGAPHLEVASRARDPRIQRAFAGCLALSPTVRPLSRAR